MLIFINATTAIPYNKVYCITYKKDEDVTCFLVDRNKKSEKWVSAKGDWRKKIVNALKVGAIALYKDYYELRA